MRLRAIFPLVALLLPVSSLPAAAPTPAVAIVYQLQGPAAWSPGRGTSIPLELFAVLPAGADLRVGPGGSLALAFPSGARYRLGAGSSATLTAGGLVRRRGPIERLAAVSPFPALGAIAAADRPGDRSAAVKVRGEIIEGLSPHGGVRSLSDRTVLRFKPVAGVSRYRVEVRGADGELKFGKETEGSEANVPPGLLAPGERYRWMVTTVDRPGPMARGEAGFETLDAKTVSTLGLEPGSNAEGTAPF